MRVLVTGASGFVGRAVLRELDGRGIEALALARRAFQAPGKTEVIEVPTPSSLSTLLDVLETTRPDCIIHLAGLAGSVSLSEMYEVNVVYAAHILAAAAKHHRPRIVISGSAAEYGRVADDAGRVAEHWPCRPESAYGVSKLAQTLHATSACAPGLNVTVARLFNPVGEGMPERLALGAFARRIRDAANGGILETGALDVVRDFIDVRDAASILVDLAGRAEFGGEIINVCSGVGLTLGDLTQRLVELSGKQLTLKQDFQRSGNSSSRIFVGDPTRLELAGMKPRPVDVDGVLGRIMGLPL